MNDPDPMQVTNKFTCELKYPFAILDSESEKEKKRQNIKDNAKFFEWKSQSTSWANMILKLFSMKVSTGFFAAYTPTLFYTVLIYGLGSTVKAALITQMSTAWQIDLTSPEPMIKLVEAVVMMRHEENLVAEEECFVMLNEIVRQP